MAKGRAGRRLENMARKAIRDYNKARENIIKNLGESYAPPERTVSELLRNNRTLRELRQEIRNLRGITSRSGRRIVKGEQGAETLTYTLKETERLNRERNARREERREKFGDVTFQPGYGESQERIRQTPKEVNFNQRSEQSWESFLKQLGKELERDENALDMQYKENYLTALEKNLGSEFANEVRELLREIRGDELYMFSLRMDYYGVFSVDFPYAPLDIETRMNEIVSAIENMRRELEK